MTKDERLNFETQLKNEFLPTNNGSKDASKISYIGARRANKT